MGKEQKYYLDIGLFQMCLWGMRELLKNFDENKLKY